MSQGRYQTGACPEEEEAGLIGLKGKTERSGLRAQTQDNWANSIKFVMLSSTFLWAQPQVGLSGTP